MHRLPGMLRRDRRDEVRVDDAAFHEVEGFGVKVVPEPIGVKEVLRTVQAGGLQDAFAGYRHTLVGEIVDRVTDPLVMHPDVPVDLEEQDRHERGLPVVAVDDVGPAVRLEHVLHGRF